MTGPEGKKFCVKLGGGKRCGVEGCNNSAIAGGPIGELRCAHHGGGRRCDYAECGKLAVKDNQGHSKFCVAHGGGKRCIVEGCEKSALKRTQRMFCKMHGSDEAQVSLSKRQAIAPVDPRREHVALAVCAIVAQQRRAV